MPADPRTIAASIRAELPMAGGTLTATMNNLGHPVGRFLRTVTPTGARNLPAPPLTHPLLVPAAGLSGGEHGTVGTAFGWLLRLRLDRHPHFIESELGRDLLPEHAQVALWELDRWIQTREQLDEPGDLERAAVVLAWCEQLYRAGPLALPSSRLVTVRPGAGPADLLDLVPQSLVEQLARLDEVARANFDGALTDAGTLTMGIPLGRAPIGADADMLSGSTLVELKCTQGTRRRDGAFVFVLNAELVRQLLGYVLLDWEAELGIDAVAVYAARFGLLWQMPLAEFLHRTGAPGDVALLREAFSLLWAA